MLNSGKEEIEKNEENEEDSEEESEKNNKEIESKKENNNNNNNQKIIPKKAKNNQYIYQKNKKNIFFIDDEDDEIDKNYPQNKLNTIKIKSPSKSIYKDSISISASETEEIESDEISENSEKSQSEPNNSNKSLNKEDNLIKKDTYILELNHKGLPNISNDEIIYCKKNSIINIILNNGIIISKDIILISNAENEFPSSFFINSLISEIKIKNEKDLTKDQYNADISSNSKYQQYLNNLNEDKSVLKQIKKYQYFPKKIDTKIIFEINTKISGNITFIFL